MKDALMQTRTIELEPGEELVMIPVECPQCGFRSEQFDTSKADKNEAMNTEIIGQTPEYKLLEKVARLELSAKRGLQINEMPGIEKVNVIPVEYCNATLKNCELFRHWVGEYFESQPLLDLEPGEVLIQVPIECPLCGFRSEELENACGDQSYAENIEGDTKSAGTAGVAMGNQTGSDHSRSKRMVNPFPQTSEEYPRGNKCNWGHWITIKKGCSIEDEQQRANNHKRLVPIINFHVCKRIYRWLCHRF